jgi:hypothetical protein
MMHATFQKLKGVFWRSGEAGKDGPGSALFNVSEIASLRRQLSASSAEAASVAKRHGVKMHPRVAAIKAKANAAR